VIDLHCHILPGLDDGAPDLAAALAMARMQVADGVTDVVATPHMFDGTYEASREAAEGALRDLREALLREGIPLRVHPGSDCHLDPRVLDTAERNNVISVDNGPYLMIEFPHEMVPPRIDESLFRLRALGLRPVLTHPERNRELQAAGASDRIAAWRTAHGLLTQVTASSLTGAWGKRAQAAGQDLLRRGLCDVIATDAHRPDWRPPCLSAGRDAAAAIVGDDAARRMVLDVPGKVLRGEVVDTQITPTPLRATCEVGVPEAQSRSWTARLRFW